MISRSSGVQSMDRHITTVVVSHRSPPLDLAMRIVTWWGSWVAVLVAAAIVAGLAWRRRASILLLLAVLVAWAGELVAVTVAKAAVQRPRPPLAIRLVTAHGWSFPSGHTANAVVVSATVGYLVSTAAGRRDVRVVIWVLACLAVGMVAFARVELGVHWTTDVIAGGLWSGCWIALLAVSARRLVRGEPRV